VPAITFTKFEFEQLAKAAEHLLQARKELPPQQWRKPQHQAVKSFAKKFANQPAEPQDGEVRILSRTDMRLIQEICQKALETLSTSILPSYEERMSKLPDKKEFYQPYYDKAVRTKEAYTAILTNIEEAL
jgi:hypothetical protein